MSNTELRSIPGSVEQVERWGRFERGFRGPDTGNPFRDVSFSATFRNGNRSVEADGFYDGEGFYIIRFMPDAEGVWTFTTTSNCQELDGLQGGFETVAPSNANRGPVRVVDRFRFAYEDGTPYLPFGTTLYHWCHYGDETEEQRTLETLAASPFNKVRMCILPTGDMDPPSLAFAGSRSAGANTEQFNPAFFAHLERRIDDLLRLGIEADVILFHPYDQKVWGFMQLPEETEEAYLRYVIARLASYRNVWWSISNEFDFNPHKEMQDWDRLFHVVTRCDPYRHLCSIHNGTKMYDYERTSMYDYSKPWVTHQSIQHWSPTLTSEWLRQCGKPVVLDEMCYEGNAPRRWGNISGQELAHRFWECMMRGGYAAHGELFEHKSHWISRGGSITGDSPQRIAFLRSLMEESQPDLWRIDSERMYTWQYFGGSKPGYWHLELPENFSYRVDLIDTWEMTVEQQPGTFSGRSTVPLPGKPYMALRIRRVEV